jgi:polyisoprenyl-phosphate glycosyltransferase
MQEMESLLPKLQEKIKVFFVLVDDGSTDSTFEEILKFQAKFPNTKALQLTSNFGAHAAFLAGLTHADGDCFAILHPDLQDPPLHLLEMVDRWEKGTKLVIGLRTKRKEPFGKRFWAFVYHQTIKRFALSHIPEGGYDLVLFDKQIRDKVVELQESNISQVYLLSSFQFPYETVPLTRLKNVVGKSTWTFQKKAKLFMDTLVGFSYFPIQLLSSLAVALILLWFGTSFYVFFKWIIGVELSITYLWFWMAITLVTVLGIMLAIVGEYLWRTLESNRKRPAYFIKELILPKPTSHD